MNDRELLESAARAVGYKPHGWDAGINRLLVEDDDGPGRPWNPLVDDGDAFRLAVKLGIDLRPREFGSEAICMAEGIAVRQLGEPEESARRAIVLVSAEIGELRALSRESGRPVERRVNNLLDPEQSVWLAGGFALDAVGAHESIQLRRHQVPRPENDHDYRKRIIARMRGESKPSYSDWVDGMDAPQTAS